MSDLDAAAARAAEVWGLPAPVLVRAGTNRVYAAGPDVLLRVGPPVHRPDREVAWFRLLATVGVRAPALLGGPVVVAQAGADGHPGVAVSAVERVVAEGPVDWRAVGEMVRRVHAIDPVGVAGLPWCGDFAHWQIDALLHEVGPLVDASALSGIDAALARWPGWWERLREEPVVCHGDLHPGNVIATVDGPVLLDWDLRSIAPIAWDHGPLMTWEHRWDGEPGTYAAFAEGYGLDLRGDWMGECMAELRNLVATLLRVRAGRTDPVAAAEAERRLRFWRGDVDAPRWHPM